MCKWECTREYCEQYEAGGIGVIRFIWVAVHPKGAAGGRLCRYRKILENESHDKCLRNTGIVCRKMIYQIEAG